MKKLYTAAVLLLTVLIGLFYFLTHRNRPSASEPVTVPFIGAVQILNGCGTPGAAQVIADILRRNGFDVKEIGNAPDWNYRHTLVAARTRNLQTAALVAKTLKTDNLIPLRNDDGLFDVTLFVGDDFEAVAEAAAGNKGDSGN